MPTKMMDMVVILPGIMGSILQKDGIDLWNVSGQAIWQVVKSLGNRLDDLQLAGDDPHGGDIEDGVVPTGLITNTHLIPGLWKIDGYNQTSKVITDNFKVIKGDIYQDREDRAANFYHFPYDWRRDNRANANILKGLLDKRLRTWREFTRNPHAKVILVAHSMGGLISRYYLEVLGGWQDARALFTFGTPYRGSVDAVNILTNGFKKQGIDLLEVLGMRKIIDSLTSIYQLIPVYPILELGGESKRVAEVANLPNIEQKRASEALAFHREIEAAVKTHPDSYATVPFVGVQQPTLQSAEFNDGKIIVSTALPAIMRDKNLDSLADGDGTVPKISSFPIEFSDRDVLDIPSFVAEAHGSLQNQPDILLNLLNKLQASQADGGTLSDIRGKGDANSRSIKAGTKGISLFLDDLYLKNEPIVIKANTNGDYSGLGRLKAQITCVSHRRSDVNLDFVNESDEWFINPESLSLEPGLYRIRVKTEKTGEEAPKPVNDLFEVAEINI